MVQINKVCQGVFLTHSFLGYKVAVCDLEDNFRLER